MYKGFLDRSSVDWLCSNLPHEFLVKLEAHLNEAHREYDMLHPFQREMLSDFEYSEYEFAPKHYWSVSSSGVVLVVTDEF